MRIAIPVTPKALSKLSKLPANSIGNILLDCNPEDVGDPNAYWPWLANSTSNMLVHLTAEQYEELKANAQASGLRLKLYIAYCLHNMASNRSRGLSESWYQQELYKRLGGRLEVSISVGRVDILTSKEVIEVKFKPGWKSAMGQALAYCTIYEQYAPALALIGRQEALIEHVCFANGIKAIYWLGADKHILTINRRTPNV